MKKYLIGSIILVLLLPVVHGLDSISQPECETYTVDNEFATFKCYTNTKHNKLDMPVDGAVKDLENDILLTQSSSKHSTEISYALSRDLSLDKTYLSFDVNDSTDNVFLHVRKDILQADIPADNNIEAVQKSGFDFLSKEVIKFKKEIPIFGQIIDGSELIIIIIIFVLITIGGVLVT